MYWLRAMPRIRCISFFIFSLVWGGRDYWEQDTGLKPEKRELRDGHFLLALPSVC